MTVKIPLSTLTFKTSLIARSIFEPSLNKTTSFIFVNSAGETAFTEFFVFFLGTSVLADSETSAFSVVIFSSVLSAAFSSPLGFLSIISSVTTTFGGACFWISSGFSSSIFLFFSATVSFVSASFFSSSTITISFARDLSSFAHCWENRTGSACR